MKYLLLAMITLASCSGSNGGRSIALKSTDTQSTTNKDTAIVKGDSAFTIGDFLLEGPKDMKFELVKKGDKPRSNTKGDTLYSDTQTVILGSWKELIGFGVYKKFKFKSSFSDFKVDSIYKGKLAGPSFRTDHYAKYFITRIKKGCKTAGVNFAGHYTLVEWGCGCMCRQMAIVDRINGNIISSGLSFQQVDGYWGCDYKIDSRMMIINSETLTEHPGYKLEMYAKPAVYALENGTVKFVE